ncbi:sulfite oxidase-like protein [Nemania abortiva]|nr:sulfite oxidase-like protein [Nemania abortiva]
MTSSSASHDHAEKHRSPQIDPLPLTEEPLNREPAVGLTIITSFITGEGAYDRNHGAIPDIDPNTHRVKVDGAVERELSLSVHELATSFPQHDVDCVVQCAGNRRHTMRTWLKEVDGVGWGDAALMNCSWRGPRLRDVIQAAGVQLCQGHVAFSCFQSKTQDDDWYGASIDLTRAMNEDADVILALERNSLPLSKNHGAPVRVVVPGVAGARSVKWIDCITVQREESPNVYQQRDYKVLPENVQTMEEADKCWDTVPAIQDMPINSVIISPRSGGSVTRDQNGTILVTGYAVPGGSDRPIVKTEAEFVDAPKRWTWCIWRVRMKVTKSSQLRIYARAVDRGGNEQSSKPRWNLRGVVYDGYGESRDVTVI